MRIAALVSGVFMRRLRAAMLGLSAAALIGAGAAAQELSTPAGDPQQVGPEALVPSPDAAAAESTRRRLNFKETAAEPAAEEAAAQSTAASADMVTAAADEPGSGSAVLDQLSLPRRLRQGAGGDVLNGSYTTGIDIAVPPFRGLEPKLRLVYDSGGGQRAGGLLAGFVGVGWQLKGVPDIVRALAGPGHAAL